MDTDVDENTLSSDTVPCITSCKTEDVKLSVNGEEDRESSFVSNSGLAEELEDDFRIASDLSFLKDSSSSQSPLENFKSSYAKSLADSYRRASLPVVVSAPKGQFYFNNEEVISLNSGYFDQNRYLSLNSPARVSTSSPSNEPVSLPTALNAVADMVQTPRGTGSCENLRNVALQEIPVYVPLEKIRKYRKNYESISGSSSSQEELVITTDGRKLVMFSGFKKLCDERILISRNGEALGNVLEKESQNEGHQLEYSQLEGRIQQLCEVLADRDNTIQQLEEDLLRMRMECQRLMVDNRSMKSNLGSGPQQPNLINSTSELPKLKQQVELLNAQLEKAERSRRTYETATRQLVDFLHTVNSTLSNSCTNLSSPTHSASFQNSTVNLQSETSYFETSRRTSDAIQRTESVYALPTHSGNRPRVNRSVSTYCVASAPPAKESSATTGRVVNAEFLVTRAKELIASLKSLTRNESVLRLHVESKKSGSSVASNNGVSLRSFKKEGFTGDDHSSTSSLQLQTSLEESPASNEAETVIQVQPPAKLHDTSQPLSLMVVGETSSNSVEQGYSSLPVSGCISRILNDSDQRLVWV